MTPPIKSAKELISFLKLISRLCSYVIYFYIRIFKVLDRSKTKTEVKEMNVILRIISEDLHCLIMHKSNELSEKTLHTQAKTCNDKQKVKVTFSEILFVEYFTTCGCTYKMFEQSYFSGCELEKSNLANT